MSHEAREPYASNIDQVIGSPEELDLFQYEIAEKNVEDAIAKGGASQTLLKARDILRKAIQLMKAIITEDDPIEQGILREKLPALNAELQEAQYKYNAEALRNGRVLKDGTIDMPWLNFMNKSCDVIAHEAADEFNSIMRMQNEDTVIAMLHVYCTKYCKNDSLPISLAVVLWKRFGNMESIRRYVQEVFKLYGDSLSNFGLSQEEAQRIHEWIGT